MTYTINGVTVDVNFRSMNDYDVCFRNGLNVYVRNDTTKNNFGLVPPLNILNICTVVRNELKKL